MRRGARSIGAMLGLAVALSGAAARAQVDAETGAAFALFDEGIRLMERGDFAEACPKLARSQQLSPNGGTLFALADCFERSGRFASAWIAYRETAARAQAAGKPEAQRKAIAAAAALEPKVAWVSVSVSALAPNLVVLRDGKDVPSAEWGVFVPLDPGVHKIEARALGRVPFATEVHAPSVAARLTVTIPDLDVAVVPPARAPSPVAPARESSVAQRLVGAGLAGLGAAGLIVGGVFGLRASAANRDASEHCRQAVYCDAEGLRLDGEARDAAAVSTVGFVVGAGALVAGAVIFFTAPRARPVPVARRSPIDEGRAPGWMGGVRVSVTPAPGGAWLSAATRF